MSVIKLLCAIVPIFLWGCASADEKRFVDGRGDVAQFITQQAITHGAKSAATNNLKPIVGPWRYFQDTNGVVVRLNRDRFPEIQTALRKTFGPPDREPIETTDGGKLGWYAVKTIGVAIHFSYDRRNSQVIVLRAQKNPLEFLKRAAEVESKQPPK